MAWTAPRTWVAGEVVTAAMMNTHVRDNLIAVFGQGGTIAVGSTANGVTQTGTVTFPVAFSSVPAVVLTMDSGNVGNPFVLECDNRTTTTFHWQFVNTSGVTYTAPVIQWIAKL